MAPKRQNASSSTPQKPSSSLQSTSTSSTSAPSSSLTSAFTPTKSSSTSSSSNAASIGDAQEILNDLWRNYLKETPQRVKLIDVFMGFLVTVGVLQFVYAVVGGNYVSACSHFFSVDAKVERMREEDVPGRGVDVVRRWPFNAFLSGFSATVGQFVLTASLRIQCNPANKKEFESVSHEREDGTGLTKVFYRAFADFVLGSLILHFFCVNFVN
ncbi:aromatic amino acid aminotransferase C56E4.03 [Physcia stellaris]|nr:aromatic amino acid aminotransferase C56E4.03 [Physcia stellaris]